MELHISLHGSKGLAEQLYQQLRERFELATDGYHLRALTKGELEVGLGAIERLNIDPPLDRVRPPCRPSVDWPPEIRRNWLFEVHRSSVKVGPSPFSGEHT